MMLCSKCSFLYPFNGWDDFNSFYTIGSGWANGLIPYKDLFEQKGPFLYFIFLLGYLISPGKFMGMFIIEVIFFGLVLYISSKIIDMFIDCKKYPMGKYLILLLYGILMTTSISFVEGGSCEEFNLLFTTITIYYIAKYIKNSDLCNMKYKDLIICGLCCGLSIMIKYTTIGLWFIMMAYICIKLIFSKKYKDAILKGLTFIIAMIIPICLFIVYFYVNDSLIDFIDSYFYINIFKYGTRASLITKILITIRNIFSAFFSNIPFIIGMYFTFCYYLRKVVKDNYKIRFNKKKILFLGIIIFFLFILFYGQTFRVYAITVGFFIFLFIIIYLYKIFNNYKLFKILSILYIIIGLGLGIDFKYMFTNRDSVVQYRFAKIINEYDNPSILHYRSIDEGFYTTSNVLPKNRFFSQVNISFDRLSQSYNEQDSIIINKEVMFVILRKFDLEKKNTFLDLNRQGRETFNKRADLDFVSTYYDLIDVYDNNNGYYKDCIYYLFKVKE